jgi:hypothetical protein
MEKDSVPEVFFCLLKRAMVHNFAGMKLNLAEKNVIIHGAEISFSPPPIISVFGILLYSLRL